MRVLAADKKPVTCVAFAPDGGRLAAASHGGTVRVWDLAAGAVARSFVLRGLFANRVRLAWSPDGARLAATNVYLHLLDPADGSRRRLTGGGTSMYEAAFSPDGAQVVGTGDRHARWAAGTGDPLPPLNLPTPRGYTAAGWPAVAFSADGARLAVSRRISRVVGNYWRNTDQVLVYDPQAEAVAAQFEWTGHPAHRVAFSPDGSVVAAAAGPVLRAWDLGTGAEVAAVQVGKLHVLGMAFAPDGRSVATVGKDRAVRLWDARTWAAARTLDWEVGRLLDVAFGPDGQTVAVASDTGKVLLFDVD